MQLIHVLCSPHRPPSPLRALLLLQRLPPLLLLQLQLQPPARPCLEPQTEHAQEHTACALHPYHPFLSCCLRLLLLWLLLLCCVMRAMLLG